MDIDYVRQHITDRLTDVEVNFSPFPHLIVENIFPDDVYEKIQKYNLFKINRGIEWDKRERSVNVTARTPYHARKQINLHNKQTYDASPEAAAFWQSMKKLFLSNHWFEHVVYSKFPAYFQIRFGDLVKEPDFFALLRRELFLQRHEVGFSLGAHTDIPTRIFTCIFSFATQSGFDEYGTALMAPNDPMIRCWGRDHYSVENFSTKKLAPYKPNNFLLFFKTRQSFHSVPAINENVPNQRYGMQFQVYEPINGLFRDLSAPELMQNARVQQGSFFERGHFWLARKLRLQGV